MPERRDLFWKVWATMLLVVLAKLAFAPGAVPAVAGLNLSLVRPLHAQGVAIDESAVCTASPDGTVLYCWSVTHTATGPTIRWKGAFKVPGT